MTISPGGTLGVLGSGQLGRMFTQAAQRLGYRVFVYSPESDSPTGQIADREFVGDWDDEDSLLQFARQISAVTFEFENVPVAALNVIERLAPSFPGPGVLQATQNRLSEKNFLRRVGLPVAPFRNINCEGDVQQFMTRDNRVRPVIVKSAVNGYDGRGQTRFSDLQQLPSAFSGTEPVTAVVEDVVDFELELSVVGVRSQSGEICCFGPIINHHVDHILDVSVAAADLLSADLQLDAFEMTRAVLEGLDVTGVLTVEMFLGSDGNLLINELAPRPHNSGHLTIEAAETSQFEQQVRCACGLAPGSMRLVRPAAMANLLGQHLSGDVDWATLAQESRVHWHLYGKSGASTGRKMGHLTALADSGDEAEQLVRFARHRLTGL